MTSFEYQERHLDSESIYADILSLVRMAGSGYGNTQLYKDPDETFLITVTPTGVTVLLTERDEVKGDIVFSYDREAQECRFHETGPWETRIELALQNWLKS